MTDIVERLRQGVDEEELPEAELVMAKAADEILRLRIALQFYTNALVTTVAPDHPGFCDDGRIARRALEPKP